MRRALVIRQCIYLLIIVACSWDWNDQLDNESINFKVKIGNLQFFFSRIQQSVDISSFQFQCISMLKLLKHHREIDCPLIWLLWFCRPRLWTWWGYLVLFFSIEYYEKFTHPQFKLYSKSQQEHHPQLCFKVTTYRIFVFLLL